MNTELRIRMARFKTQDPQLLVGQPRQMSLFPRL